MRAQSTDFMSTFSGIHLLIYFIYAPFISVIVKYLICTKLRMFKKTLPCALMSHRVISERRSFHFTFSFISPNIQK